MEINKKKALQLILLFGLVSLFGDIVYEGARSVNGPYLKTLGTSAVIVGIIAGAGEFLGYAIRLVSGYLSDRTRAYWLFVFLGYGALISVPLLSLTGTWQIAAFFIVSERIGKALRSPARDTIMSQATKQIGTGLGFGIAEAMDQIGAITGPLIFTALFLFTGAGTKNIHDYQKGYGLFWLPFILLLLCILFAYRKFPHPEQFEKDTEAEKDGKLTKLFWLYTAFSFVATMGFANFMLLGYHFKVKGIFSDALIPFMYAIAMGIDAVAALVIGKMYDLSKARNKNSTGGLATLSIIPVLSIAVIFLAFSGNVLLAIVSMLFWGVVMGAHETIMRSAIADLTPLNKRGTGYGIFNAGYGIAAFAGSVLIGALYERSLAVLIIAVVIVEIAAMGLFFAMRKEAQIKWMPKI